MINEGNKVVELFNELKKGYKGPRVQTVNNIRINFKSGAKSKGKKWLTYIAKECNYNNA